MDELFPPCEDWFEDFILIVTQIQPLWALKGRRRHEKTPSNAVFQNAILHHSTIFCLCHIPLVSLQDKRCWLFYDVDVFVSSFTHLNRSHKLI
jgi:hypothetical protein